MEADVSDGFVEELDYPFNRFGLPVPSSPTKPWKTLRVSNSSHSLGPLSISRRKKFDLLSLSVRYLAPATRVAGFEVFFSGRFWVFPDTTSTIAFSTLMAVSLPQDLNIDVDIREQYRRRGIYDSLVYTADIRLDGPFLSNPISTRFRKTSIALTGRRLISSWRCRIPELSKTRPC